MPSSLAPEARAALLRWFDVHGRALAFRSTRDPYAVLVSEVMAQQTQISRVVEPWRRFVTRFPTIESLAAATPADVLRAWQGMGYDRRALNLRLAARRIREEHGGHVPDDLVALERLPGVGPYTARAVAAIAFGKPVGAVDTNVRRVLGRALFGTSLDQDRPGAIQGAADASVDPARPADWTHAVMDVGAVLCRPTRPDCPSCPLRPWCAYAATARVPTAAGSLRTRTAATVPFASTTRWLRGRIVDRLRAGAEESWTTIEAPIGIHDDRAIASALAALARDGVVEVDSTDPFVARLAIA
jgi:A/G-specific adenine glycosylase